MTGPDDNPGLDCITGAHLLFDVLDEQGHEVGGWCAWCGTGAYDADRIGDDGTAIGFIPVIRVRVPDNFHREPVT